MAGKHQLKHRQVQHAAPHRAVEVVDARTHTMHSLTDKARSVPFPADAEHADLMRRKVA